MSIQTMEDRRAGLDAFANNPGNGNSSPTPAVVRPLAGPADRVFGAQQVAVYRDEAKILQKLAALGAAAGTDWFFRWPVKKKGGGQDWIEGASIKLANDVARIYGNCDVDVRVMDLGDTWLFYARFTDFETGYSLTRPFQQRKSQATMNTDKDRALDIAFQIGASKAIRNVVVNALQTFSDYAFDAARSSLVEKIGKDIEKWKTRTIEGIAKIPVELVRVETVIGRAAKDWTAPDVAKVIAMMQAIADGMATADDTFPPIGARAEPSTEGDDDDAPTEVDKFAEGKTEGQANNGTPAGNGNQAANANQASPQSSPAAGQPAPQTSQSSQAAEQQGAGAAPGGTQPAAAAGKEATPTTEAAYIAHAHAWRDALLDPDVGEKQWKAEKSLRNKCNVSPEMRDELEKALKAKVAQLRKG